jgi:hypothetical protein
MVFLFLVTDRNRERKLILHQHFGERSNSKNSSIRNASLTSEVSESKAIICINSSKQNDAEFSFVIEKLASRISWILE